MKDFKNILWDFDGVILDSMSVRDWGFREIFKDFSFEQVDQLISYHRANGGLSRYVKIKYFYETILGKSISEKQILNYAENFSKLMKSELINPANLINDSLEFIEANYKNYNFHIVSGSDQEELRFLCKELKLTKYFHSIHGSPTPKNKLVNDLLSEYNYKISQTCLIGDSQNDFEAAANNKICFFGYNNKLLKCFDYIENFNDLI